MAKGRYNRFEVVKSNPVLHIFQPPNKYGYRVNVSHPAIIPLFRRYKNWKGIPPWCPLSDKERFEFEEYIFKHFRNEDH